MEEVLGSLRVMSEEVHVLQPEAGAEANQRAGVVVVVAVATGTGEGTGMMTSRWSGNDFIMLVGRLPPLEFPITSGTMIVESSRLRDSPR